MREKNSYLTCILGQKKFNQSASPYGLTRNCLISNHLCTRIWVRNMIGLFIKAIGRNFVHLKILLFLTHLRPRYPFLDIYKWFWGGSLFWGLRPSFSTHPYWLRPNYAPAYQGSCFSFIIFSIVNRGDWLEKPANIKVENNGAVGYVGSSLTVHNPLFFGHKLWLSKLMQCFYWSVLSSKW